MSEFIWTLVGALVSTSLSLGIPTFQLWYKNRKQKQIFREWYSEYQGIDEPPGTWVVEKVDISLQFGKIIIKNKENDHGYNYTAVGKIVDNSNIVGDWVSIKPGANSYGCFMLTISAQGGCMFGYWLGTDEAHSRRFGRWVLAVKEEQINTTKNILEKARKSRLAKDN